MLDSALPIVAVIQPLLNAYQNNQQVILVAPPGAGKTTQIPLALLELHQQQQGRSGKILVIEPRRIAAVNAAKRMAYHLGESVGERVGYRVRLDVKVSDKTQVEVITDGVLLRLLQSDPELSGIDCIIFDEFHERNVNSDIALALSLYCRDLFRDDLPLKLIIMSATLDISSIEQFFSQQQLVAPLVCSEGKSFPVDIHYAEKNSDAGSLVRDAKHCVERVIEEQQGSVLVFMPGKKEINQLAQELSQLNLSTVQINPLMGDMPLAQQQEAVKPAPDGLRKIVIATNIAESSLTIDDVRIVVDGGYQRQARFDARSGLSRLHTVRISQASADQRTGRAGRTQSGLCYRLWNEQQQQLLALHSTPAIDESDLSDLALLLCDWGVDASELAWLSDPPQRHYQQALDLLQQLALVNDQQVLTALGQNVLQFAAHPRLAAMLLKAELLGLTTMGAQLAALLSERDPLNNNSADIEERLLWLNDDSNSLNKNAKHRLLKQADQFLKAMKAELKEAVSYEDISRAGLLLAFAYPDRIGQRKQGDNYTLSNGRGVQFHPENSCKRSAYLVAVDCGGKANNQRDMIFLAAAISLDNIKEHLQDYIHEATYTDWNSAGRFVASSRQRLGHLILSEQPLKQVGDDERVSALLHWLRETKLSVLPWDKNSLQLQARAALLNSVLEKQLPVIDNKALLDNLELFIAPYLHNVRDQQAIKQLNMLEILNAYLGWENTQQLKKMCPERFTLPSGNSYAIDYSQQPPVLAAKLQEFFGQIQTPAIINEQLPLMLHLLSPAGRPLQLTQDLKSFWQGAYSDVKKDMKGRYPKHPWPDDPLTALPSNKTKKRLEH